jgi:hypothetical protein
MQIVGRLLRRDVLAGLADGGEHLITHPVLEAFSFRLVAAHDQRVEAGFADERGLLGSAHGVTNRYTIPMTLADMICNGFSAIGVPQDAGSICSTKPYVALVVEARAHVVPLEVEHLHVHGRWC